MSHTRIDLVWTDNADTEEGFEIERNGTLLEATLAANSESNSDTGLSLNAASYTADGVNFDMHYVDECPPEPIQRSLAPV